MKCFLIGSSEITKSPALNSGLVPKAVSVPLRSFLWNCDAKAVLPQVYWQDSTVDIS